MSAAAPTSRSGWRRALDPRIWIGVAITIAAGWFALRDVDFALVGQAMGRAHLGWLIVPSFAAYAASLWVRALRWRYLASGVCVVEPGPAYRANAIGFMINNLLPLRMGEVVRGLVLARELRAPAPAIFGTIVLERVVDLVSMVAIAAVVIADQVDLELLGVVALLPLAFVAVLRFWPEPLLRLAHRILTVLLPERFAERAESLLRELAAGLAGLRTTRDLVMVGLYSFLLWGVVCMIPFWAALHSLGIDAGGPIDTIHASLVVMVAVGAAVAIPSAPGFFGTYQAAAKLALLPLGVTEEVALAAGILLHAVFWVTFVVLGLLALRGGRLRVGEALASASASDASPAT